MSEKISFKEMLRQVKFSEFVRGCQMPMGYMEGYPMLRRRNGQLCMEVPFLRYQITGQVDKSLVFPIRYVVTVTLPGLRPVEFRDLSLESAFREMDFNKPIGYFRHEAIQGLNKHEFAAKKDELFRLYDAVIDGTATDEQAKQMGQLLKMLAEPCQMPIYQELNPLFYQQFFA